MQRITFQLLVLWWTILTCTFLPQKSAALECYECSTIEPENCANNTQKECIYPFVDSCYYVKQSGNITERGCLTRKMANCYRDTGEKDCLIYKSPYHFEVGFSECVNEIDDGGVSELKRMYLVAKASSSEYITCKCSGDLCNTGIDVTPAPKQQNGAFNLGNRLNYSNLVMLGAAVTGYLLM